MKAELIVDADIVGKKRIFIKKFAKPYFNHPLHFHQFCELVWIQKGHGKIIIGDYVGDFAEGELIMEGAGLPHLWKSNEAFYKKEKGSLQKRLVFISPRSCSKVSPMTRLFYPPAG